MEFYKCVGQSQGFSEKLHLTGKTTIFPRPVRTSSRNCRWCCSWTKRKCCSNILEHPYVPQKHSSYASTTYNTQQRTRPAVTMDWDGICTAHLFLYTQLLASHGSASTLRCRVSLHHKRINKYITKTSYMTQKTKYKRLRRKDHDILLSGTTLNKACTWKNSEWPQTIPGQKLYEQGYFICKSLRKK